MTPEVQSWLKECRLIKLGRYSLLWVLMAALSACQQLPGEPRKATTKSSESAPIASARVPLTQQERLRRLLADADYALSRDRLLHPIEDNAFDRYQAVLLVDPTNSQAKTGLQTIALRYIEMARTSIGRGQYALAQEYIGNARSIDPASPLLDEVNQSLRRQRAANPPPPAYVPGPNEHLLDIKALNQKTPELLARLTELAKMAQASGDLVMIHARNDAEGRWIYSQMRDALEDYLLRGDIRIASQPRVQFIPVE